MKCGNCHREIVSDSYFCTWCDHFLPAPELGERAGLFARFFAASIDPLIGLVVYLLAIGLFGSISPDSGVMTAVIFPFVYFVWFLTLLRKGKTPGKLLLGLQVVDHRNGEIPGFARMFVREGFGKIISGLFLGLGYFWAIFDRNHQAWHDKIAGTVVLKVHRSRIEQPAIVPEITPDYMELPPEAPTAANRTMPPLSGAPDSSRSATTDAFAGPDSNRWHEATEVQSAAPPRATPSELAVYPKHTLIDDPAQESRGPPIPPSAGTATSKKTLTMESGTQSTFLQAMRENTALALALAGFLAGGLAVYLVHIRHESQTALVRETSGIDSVQPNREDEKVRALNERLARLEAEHQQKFTGQSPELASTMPRPESSANSSGTADHPEFAPAIRIGDRYTYETVDPDDSKQNNITHREIIGFSDGHYLQRNINAKSGYTRLLHYDPSWNLISTGRPNGVEITFVPPLKYFDFPLFVGKTWEGRSVKTDLKTGASYTHILHGAVTGKENITIPAGTFETYKIVLNIEMLEGRKRTVGKDVSWYAPAARRTVRSETESQDPDTGVVSRKTIKLLSFELK